MSKSRKAAVKAAKKAAKLNEKMNKMANNETQKPQEEQKPEVKQETKQEVKPENKPEEKKLEAKKPEEKKPEEKPEDKKPEQKKSEQKKQEQKKPKKEEKVPTIIPEEVSEVEAREKVSKLVEIPTNISENSNSNYPMLGYVMWEKYGKNVELQKQYPEFYNSMMRSLDVVVMLGLIDARQDLLNRGEKGELTFNVDPSMIMPLQNIAEMLGVTLSTTKTIESKSGEQQLQLQFKEVPEELKDNKKIDTYEVDPSKITTEEELKNSLDGMIRDGHNIAENLSKTVNWYREYKLFKEENADNKLKIDNMSVGEIMNEIFKLIQPTSILKGLGRSIYLYAKGQKSPVMAHAILHHHIAKFGWTEEDIASAVRCLITEQFRYNLEKNSKLQEKDDDAVMSLISNLDNTYINGLFDDLTLDPKQEGDDTKRDELENRKGIAQKIIGSVRTNYFEKDAQNKITRDELQLAVGRIINLYRDPMFRLAEYMGTSYTAPKTGEYPEKKDAGQKKN